MKQDYTNWTALVVGEREPLGDDRFIFFEHDLVEKRQKLCFVDDIISTSALGQHRLLAADCLADRFHSFMEILTGKISQQKRDWLANTMAHKMEHAFHLVDESDPKSYLLVQDHSKVWHPYYQDKGIMWTDKKSPLYIKMLSSTSITSNASNQVGDQKKKYTKYVLGFGSWSVSDTDLYGFKTLKSRIRSEQHELGDFGFGSFRLPVVSLLKNKFIEIRTAK